MITITRRSADDLAESTWRFSVNVETGSDKINLRLRYFTHGERPSKRHGFKIVAGYDLTDRRLSTMTRAQVIIPLDVMKELTTGLKIVVD